MSKEKRIIVQDKNIKGKVGKTVLQNELVKLKELIDKYSPLYDVTGYVLNGGTGLSLEAKKIWNEEKESFNKIGIDMEYNTLAEVDKINDVLYNRIKNKNSY